MAAIESKRELFENFEGLQNSRIVRISETEAITIAEYDSEENLENSEDTPNRTRSLISNLLNINTRSNDFLVNNTLSNVLNSLSKNTFCLYSAIKLIDEFFEIGFNG